MPIWRLRAGGAKVTGSPMKNRPWEATFSPTGFVVREGAQQVPAFGVDCFLALYQLGFDQGDYTTPSMQFLQRIATTFVQFLLEDGDLA